jgi:hypothetical protein
MSIPFECVFCHAVVAGDPDEHVCAEKTVAIVGTRDFQTPAIAAHFKQAVEKYVNALPPGTVVVTGGARGVDSWAEQAAVAAGLMVVVYTAKWRELGKAAGMIRNTEIVKRCDRLVAFWNGKSRGTADTITKARKAGKSVEVCS